LKLNMDLENIFETSKPHSKHREGNILSARGLAVKNINAAKLRVVELELELIQTHMTQKPMLWVEVGAGSCSRCACVAHKGHARENRGAWASAACKALGCLVVHHRYLTVVPSPLPRCASQVLDRAAQANARGAAQILDRGAQAAARGAARCASQVLHRGARAAARGAATLPQQEKNNSADVQRSSINITGFICTVSN
jgi:hypothetical protein